MSAYERGCKGVSVSEGIATLVWVNNCCCLEIREAGIRSSQEPSQDWTHKHFPLEVAGQERVCSLKRKYKLGTFWWCCNKFPMCLHGIKL